MRLGDRVLACVCARGNAFRNTVEESVPCRWPGSGALDQC